MIKKKPGKLRQITGGQIRAARALLRWTAQDLADQSHVGVATVRRAEAIDGPVLITAANAEMIARTLETAGIELLNDDEPGVRLKKKKK
jgi:transcriptional regulator with XRE-family HTH domain